MDKTDQSSGKSVTLSRQQVAAILALFVASLVLVGLLAGLLRPSVRSTSVSSAAAQSRAENGIDEQPWMNIRLPVDVLPDHYELTLFPDIYSTGDDAKFTGNVSITINVTVHPVRHLLVHSNQLDITRTSVKRIIGKDVDETLRVARNFSYAPNQYWVVELDRPVEVDSTVVLHMQFSGSMTSGIVGLYRSRYIDSRNNQTRYIATTKFQPTEARRAFPCFDEPSFKSTFTITLIHHSNFKALSNMPPQSTKPYDTGSSLVETKFQKSVPMVTYLACFIVGDFDYKEKHTARGTPFRVYATPDKIDQVDYSLDIGVCVLEEYEKIFGLPYPLPKIDQIAIPDFVAGAMENWGLITYREVNLLFNESEASPSNKERVATVVAHELAHMWFGNLVTMKWWDDLWLNEGFASYVEYLGVNAYHKDWNMDSQFLVEDLFPVMEVDAGLSSHPIVVPVSHPDQITEVFDRISYSKGASVLRMLQTVLGEDKFQRGLQNYMAEHQYKTTVTDDLWDALSKIEGAPNVKSFMDTWTRQMGFPVVEISVVGQELRLHQERFLLDPRGDKTQPPSPYNYLWKIPVTCRSSTGQSIESFWFNERKASRRLPFSFNHTTDWIKCNVNETAYYRVSYIDSNWKKLAAALNSRTQVLTVNDRTGLIDNSFSSAQAGLVSYNIPLELSSYMQHENDYAPWKIFNYHVSYLQNMLTYSVHYGSWQAYMRRIVGSAFQRFGLNGTANHLERMTRATVARLACGNGDVNCLRGVSSMFLAWLNNGQYVDPAIRDIVYVYGIAENGNEEIWNKVWQRYMVATIPQEKNLLLKALTKTRVVWLLHRLLEFSTDDTKVRSQDFFSVIAYMSSNPVGRPIVWNWVRINWQKLVDRFTLSNRGLGRMVPGIVADFNTPFQLEEVENFFNKYPNAGAGDRARKQALEAIRRNIEWSSRHSDRIANWLHVNN